MMSGTNGAGLIREHFLFPLKIKTMSVLAVYHLPIFVFIASSVLSVLSFRHRIRHGPTTNTLVRQRRPLQFHQVLPPNEINSRVIVVGDVHGCLDELQALLVKCKYTDSDKVVLVGDLVNKGPLSAEVVQFARKIGALSVRGNHDQSALDRLANGDRKDLSFLDRLSREDIDWLDNLPYTLSIPSLDAIVVHAGLLPDRELHDQEPLFMMNMRSIEVPEAVSPAVGDNRRGNPLQGSKQSAVSGKSVMWASMWKKQPHVYFGHDAKAGLQLWEHCTGLDSGAVYGKFLTAVILPDREFVQVPVPQYASPK